MNKTDEKETEEQEQDTSIYWEEEVRVH